MYFSFGFFICLAEIFLFLALSRGLVGPVVSIVTSNGILVGVFHIALYGVMPSLLQTLGILLAFFGIIILSSGDMICRSIGRKCLRRNLKNKEKEQVTRYH